jgi:hypothetical protein
VSSPFLSAPSRLQSLTSHPISIEHCFRQGQDQQRRCHCPRLHSSVSELFAEFSFSGTY